MFRSALRSVDGFMVVLIATLIVGILVPLPAATADGFGVAATISIVLLFLTFGARLPTREVLDGIRNIRLQGAILLATYAVFPLLGVAAYALVEPLIGEAALGVLYASLLPSTLTSSAAYTSVARGNVPAAVTAAAVSNLLGLAITPALVVLLTGRGGQSGTSGLQVVVLELLLPFALGQCLQPMVGDRLRRMRWLSLGVDRAAILLSVFSAAAIATRGGVWSSMSWAAILVVVAASLLLLGAVLVLSRLVATWLRLDRADTVTLILCGSAKSIGTGLPMAAVLFPAATVALVSIPVIVLHQLQLMVSAILSRRAAEEPSV